MTARPAVFAGALLGMVLLGAPAVAADPVAIVEDVGAHVRGVGAMDYVSAGTVVHLENGKITLGYLKSCVHEVIAGGTVTIGALQSTVSSDASVTRTRVECDGGRMRLSAQQAAQGGVFALRGKQPLPDPDVVLFGTAPLLRLDDPGTVKIERLDQTADPITITVAAGTNPVYDFAEHDVRFAPGLYRATGPHGTVVFRISPQARATDVPVIGRLLHL